jgi:hypothetical protein
MQPILGKNAIIEFKKEGNYVPFVCATSISINVSREKKSVKTIGDGINRRYRTQSIGYTISLSGLIPYDDDIDMTAFDLLPYLQSAVDIEYQIIFQKIDGTTYKLIKGVAGIDSMNFEAPTDFVRGSIEMTGNGPYVITDIEDVCDKVIRRASFSVTSNVLHVGIISLNSGTVPRYDYRIDGGAINTSLFTGWPVNLNSPTGHIIEIWPVCENGIYGTKYTYTF